MRGLRTCLIRIVFCSLFVASFSQVNYMRYRNEEIDATLKEASQRVDLTERAKLCQRIEEMAAESCPMIPLFFLSVDRVYQSSVRGIEVTALGEEAVSFHRVWLRTSFRTLMSGSNQFMSERPSRKRPLNKRRFISLRYRFIFIISCLLILPFRNAWLHSYHPPKCNNPRTVGAKRPGHIKKPCRYVEGLLGYVQLHCP